MPKENSVAPERFVRVGHLKTVDEFRAHLDSLGVSLPVDDEIEKAPDSPLAQPYDHRGFKIGNRWCIHPMEGWDAKTDGNPSEYTIRRWQNFGLSGAKLIWGGEAVAVQPEGRANPNQLYAADHSKAGIGKLRDELLRVHREHIGDTDDLYVGLQLTHSGRFCRPFDKAKMEPRTLYRHPILDSKFHIESDDPVLSDDEIKTLIEDYHRAASMASDLGYQFVDIKHCHGYLGHEFLSAFTRPGPYGGSFENRTRFLREIVEGVRANNPGLDIGIRLSAFDFVPFRPDPEKGDGRRLGPGIPEPFVDLLPYKYGFSTNQDNPIEPDTSDTCQFIDLLRELDITLVNLTAGSPYYNPHIQRPAYYPPSDGYQPPVDPLVDVARQIDFVAQIKARYPDVCLVGTAYSYLQEYLPHVGQRAVRDNLVDFVGLGRVVLSYPDLPQDVLTKGELVTRKICRTFSDCTTAPRNGMISGCFPLDPFYKKTPEGKRLRDIKKETPL
ncbi:MAG TPA: NADH:flavin oxidoreductase [Candidatus Latescibacteria bacterium]|jgi:2,4-dienoyl-CoA reductase-like NADH-dependent reductase (Old Yellow Enzyme family)|nr:NADH:flavin oxidoreductase [Candidatus Latescibacterota bacterium]